MYLRRELKKGSTELLILSVLQQRSMYGYQINKIVGERTGGAFRFNEGSLYPTLYKLEGRGMVRARWEAIGGRRRRYYHLTEKGRKALARQRAEWRDFVSAVNLALGPA